MEEMVCLHGLFIDPLYILCGRTVNMSIQCSYFFTVFLVIWAEDPVDV